MLPRYDEDFERPCCPPRAHGDECFVLSHDTFLYVGLELRVIFEHMAATLLAMVFLELFEFKRRLFG